MSMQQGVWKVGARPTALVADRLASEDLLEEMIVADISILSPDWMLIGRQIRTSHNGIPDLLAIARDGSLVLVELKRDRTPRDVIAQALDYASWVERLGAEEITGIYSRFSNGGSLAEAFKRRFNAELEEDMLNASHQVVVVASELDPLSERIVQYLSDREIPINVLFFQVFRDGSEQYLSRSWMIDPAETQSNLANNTKGDGAEREPWNGEYYVSYGGWKARSWDDARKYGFISAGGGAWYSRTLDLLEPGARIWVKIPQTGYVGVARVTGPVEGIATFQVQTPEGRKPVTEVLQYAKDLLIEAQDPEKAERFVPVEWLETVPLDQAVNEVGFFGNQNSVCRPTVAKWRHTVDALKKRFPHYDRN